MRETRLYGSEGGEAKAFPTPIRSLRTGNGWNVPSPSFVCKNLKTCDTTLQLCRVD